MIGSLAPGQELDVAAVRAQFPILGITPWGKPLVYLDNAATTQKPQVVIDTVTRFYSAENANIHRAVHYLGETATRLYEGARETVRSFINAGSTEEIVFVRGCTEAINLVAFGFARGSLGPGDEVLISAMEHHSNIVPWQMACEQSGATLRVIPMSTEGELLIEEVAGLINDRTKIVAVVQVSNALGTVNPVREIIRLAHEKGVPVLVDGAQAVPHMHVDVQELDADFYAFSGHKVYGPTGIGVLYGKKEWLEKLPPYQGGGDMIRTVTFEKSEYNVLPYRFEAGTPNVAGSVGLAAALRFLQDVGIAAIAAHEQQLLTAATELLSELPEVRLIGTAQSKASVISFVVKGVHPHDLGTILDRDGVAIRAGHHCAQPVMDFYGVPATARVSFAAYNTIDEAHALTESVKKAIKLFA